MYAPMYMASRISQWFHCSRETSLRRFSTAIPPVNGKDPLTYVFSALGAAAAFAGLQYHITDGLRTEFRSDMSSLRAEFGMQFDHINNRLDHLALLAEGRPSTQQKPAACSARQPDNKQI